ncbi:MAG: c-type cytochrome [Planctomycetaceae bacterium]|nr:c-type cytochrome [Planctomycetaceae bacterium]
MYQILVFLLLFPQQGNELLDAVNSERGGRHWIDQKPDPAKSPEESQACFQIEPGCRLELVAAEPLVFDPVWIDFDQQGRMFVAEYSDYPIGPVNADGTAKEGEPSLSRIVMLQDRDGDGRMDHRTVFADNLTFCHSFHPLLDGILACAQSHILFLKDTDGDGRADVREVWFDGFVAAHPQMQIGSPQFGLDGQIYLTYAPGKIVCARPGFETTEPQTMPRQDMRFDFRTMQMEPISGLGQFGNTVDNDGHRFFSTNRNPIMMEMIPEEAGRRNPFAIVSRRHTDVGPSGGDTRVYPLVAMKSNWLSHAGTHTSACGVSAYRGDLWDDDFQQSVFVCEPVGHLVTRSIVRGQKEAPEPDARRAREKADFLASSDTWFRPASLRTGPDGALYLADMYRMWVEHPKFLPPEIAARIDWRAGEDRGRIWRIVPEASSSKPHSFKAPESTRDFVAVLDDSNGWRRQMAQRVLLERNDPSCKALLISQLQSSQTSPYGKIHTLWTLQALHLLSDSDLLPLLKDSSTPLRLQAAKVAAQRAVDSDSVREALLRLAEDASPEIQLQVALAAGLRTNDASVSALKSIAQQRFTSPWFQQAVLSSSAECAGAIVSHLLRTADQTKGAQRTQLTTLLTDLAAVVGVRGDAEELGVVLNSAVDHQSVPQWASMAVLTGLAKGLPRHKGELQQKSLAALLKNPLPQTASATAAIEQLLQQSSDCILDSGRGLSERLAAVGLLSSQSPAALATATEVILSPGQPQELQSAVLQAVGGTAADTVLARWDSLGPGVRSQAISLLLARPATTQKLLSLMSAGSILPGAVDIDQRVRLLQHSDEQIRTLAGQIFGGVVSANRKAVADEYSPALNLTATAAAGALVFEKTCSKCHRIDGKGHQVGPDISDTRNRSRDALLYDILDPNRRVDPQFTEYVIVTTDGRTLNGLLVSDSGDQIVLRQPEGREQTIARTDIEELKASSKSLMPEGIEKDVTVQQMADLLEFLKAR